MASCRRSPYEELAAAVREACAAAAARRHRVHAGRDAHQRPAEWAAVRAADRGRCAADRCRADGGLSSTSASCRSAARRAGCDAAPVKIMLARARRRGRRRAKRSWRASSPRCTARDGRWRSTPSASAPSPPPCDAIEAARARGARATITAIASSTAALLPEGMAARDRAAGHRRRQPAVVRLRARRSLPAARAGGAARGAVRVPDAARRGRARWPPARTRPVTAPEPLASIAAAADRRAASGRRRRRRARRSLSHEALALVDGGAARAAFLEAERGRDPARACGPISSCCRRVPWRRPAGAASPAALRSGSGWPVREA